MSIQEKIFFPGKRSGILRLFGLDTVEELQHSKEITLNKEVFLNAESAISLSAVDTCERALDVRSWDNATPEFKEYDLSEPFELSSLRTIGISESRYRLNFNRIFAKPVSMFFHSHPSFSDDYLIHHSMKRLKVGETKYIYPEQFICFLQACAANFAADDIKEFDNRIRYYGSFMMGTVKGYRLIVNPNMSLPFVESHVQAKKCSEGLGSLINQEWANMTKDRGYITDIEKYLDAQSELIKEYCDSKGLLYFYNRSHHNHILKRD